MPKASYSVPYNVDFGKRGGEFVFGRGQAGWTTREFSSAREALKFARSIPAEARTRGHDRLVARLTEDAAFLDAAGVSDRPNRPHKPKRGIKGLGWTRAEHRAEAMSDIKHIRHLKAVAEDKSLSCPRRYNALLDLARYTTMTNEHIRSMSPARGVVRGDTKIDTRLGLRRSVRRTQLEILKDCIRTRSKR